MTSLQAGDKAPDFSGTNEKGEQVWLADVVDKPTVINFVYYRCPGICSPLMEGVAGVMERSDLVPGKDYQVLTISFDPSETIDLGIRKKTNYLALMNNETKIEEAKTGWLFFVSDSASIIRATNATGFKYKKTGNDFFSKAYLLSRQFTTSLKTRMISSLFSRPGKVLDVGSGTGELLIALKNEGWNSGGNNRMLNSLKQHNMIKNKHIPLIYKCNSRQNRLKLLAGLIDSDGYLSHSKSDYQFCQSLEHEELIDDVIYLCRSLGFACYKNKKKTSKIQVTDSVSHLVICNGCLRCVRWGGIICKFAVPISIRGRSILIISILMICSILE